MTDLNAKYVFWLLCLQYSGRCSRDYKIGHAIHLPNRRTELLRLPKHFPRRSGGSCTLFEDLGVPSLSRALARSASEKLPGTARRFFPTSPTRLLAPRLRPSALAFHVKEAP